MTLGGRVWNTLDENDRYLLLSATYPRRSEELLDLESSKNWNALLPSTQSDLLDRDWSMILDRNVRPEDY